MAADGFPRPWNENRRAHRLNAHFLLAVFGTLLPREDGTLNQHFMKPRFATFTKEEDVWFAICSKCLSGVFKSACVCRFDSFPFALSRGGGGGVIDPEVCTKGPTVRG